MISPFQTQLGQHPITLHLLPNGSIIFFPHFNGLGMTDYCDNLVVDIHQQGIYLYDTETRDEDNIVFGNAVEYKTRPLILQWLKSFNLKYNMMF